MEERKGGRRKQRSNGHPKKGDELERVWERKERLGREEINKK
jgi:hypothetical protein